MWRITSSQRVFIPKSPTLRQLQTLKSFIPRQQYRFITNEKNTYHRNTWLQEMKLWIQKNLLLFKGMMIHRRVYTIGKRKHVISYSDMAGHSSFLFLACMYLENDILSLRFYAISGICCSIIFQYYRQQPLWIPIRWNTVFLCINIIMTMILLKERHDVHQLSTEERSIFTQIFQLKGMSEVDFLHLILLSKRMVFKKGQRIVSGEEKNTRLYLVLSGKLGTYKNGMKVAEIHQNQFVGSMSYKTWEGQMNKREKERNGKRDAYLNWNIHKELSDEYNPLFLLYDKDKNQKISSSSSSSSSKDDEIMKLHLMKETNDGVEGHADVICLEDCIVFSWNFNRLYELISKYPSLGFAFERTLSEDLGRKMSIVMNDEPKQRYETMLTGAIMDGETTELSKQMLEKFRRKHHIDYNTHVQLLHKHGWTENDFDAGYLGAPSAQTLIEYFQLLQAAIESPKGVTWATRSKLREFRQIHGIRSETHVEALKRLSWTIDDYEVGKKLPQKVTSNRTNTSSKQ